MDKVTVQQNIVNFVRKYKYMFLILLLGIALMLIPPSNKKKPPDTTVIGENLQNEDTICRDLQHILMQVQGAGKVEVMLTVSAGEEIKYQTDIKITSGDTGSQQQDTVIISDGSHGQGGLIQQKIPPRYQGAVVVCQGADQPAVRLAVTEAVSRATGLDSSKISVLKMK